MTGIDREQLRAQHDWMSKGTFDAFFISYRALRKLADAGKVTPELSGELMELASPGNVTAFRRRVYALTQDHPGIVTITPPYDYSGTRAPGSPRLPRPVRQPDPRRSEVREQMSWMSDGTFAAYWSGVQALLRLVKAGLISYDQAEQIRKDIPKMPSGRPNIHEFQRRVKIIEQRVEAKYGQRTSDSHTPHDLSENGQQHDGSQGSADLPQVTAPVTGGRKLVPVSREGRRVKLAWVDAGT